MVWGENDNEIEKVMWQSGPSGHDIVGPICPQIKNNKKPSKHSSLNNNTIFVVRNNSASSTLSNTCVELNVDHKTNTNEQF